MQIKLDGKVGKMEYWNGETEDCELKTVN